MSKFTSAERHRRTSRARVSGLAVAVTAGLFLSGCAQADPVTSAGSEGSSSGDCDLSATFPTGAVELIVPWAAGGGTDSVARFLGIQLADRLDANVNVVNRDGGGGVIGHTAIANGTPDGSVIGLTTVEITMMHWQGLTELNYEDMTPIAQTNLDAAGITVAVDAPWQTVEELLADAKAHPGEFVGSGTSIGGIWDLARAGMLLEADMAPDAIRWVPSGGAAPALQELAAGGIDVSFSSLAENTTMIAAGEVRPLAVMAEERDPNYPDVPTLKEAGVDFAMGVWRGITGPAGMNEDIVAELDCHLDDIVHSSEYTDFMATTGFGVEWRGAEEFAAFMAKEDDAKGVIMEETGLAG
jgi:tripartite-type tricarboxylate transporter receptor subunit TctC